MESWLDGGWGRGEVVVGTLGWASDKTTMKKCCCSVTFSPCRRTLFLSPPCPNVFFLPKADCVRKQGLQFIFWLRSWALQSQFGTVCVSFYWGLLPQHEGVQRWFHQKAFVAPAYKLLTVQYWTMMWSAEFTFQLWDYSMNKFNCITVSLQFML